jgi:Tfp pilus assembly protein PilO
VKDQLIKNLHWFIISYALFGLYEIYDTKAIELETVSQQIPKMKNNVAKLKKKIAEINQFKKDLEQSEDRVRIVVQQIEKIQKQLPTQINDTEVQSILTEMSHALKIQDPSTQPLKEDSHGFYYAKNYKYSAKGTFLQFLILFEKLEELASRDRILNVKNFSFNVSETADKKSRFQILDFETTIESFRYNPSHREGPR